MFLPGALGSPRVPTFVTWGAVEMEEATEGRVGTKLMLKEVLERDRVQGVALLVSGYTGEHLRVSYGHCGCCVSGSWTGEPSICPAKQGLLSFEPTRMLPIAG